MALPTPLSRQTLENISGFSKVRVTQWGKPLDKANHVLFYFGGMPASSEEPTLHSAQTGGQDIYASRNIHLICVDKPGMGGTSFKYNFSVRKDWPRLISQVADQLEVSRDRKYSVMGMSNGGPHAMACLTHPDDEIRNRVEAGVVVVGVSDVWESGYFSWRHPSGMFEGLYNSLPVAITGPLNCLGLKSAILFAFSFGRYESIFKQDHLKSDDAKQGIKKLLQDGCSTFGLGTAIDCQQGLSPLFSNGSNATEAYRKISVPVSLWYGTEDGSVPMSSAEWLEKTVPVAVLHKVKDSHFLYFNHGEKVLDDLVSRLNGRDDAKNN